MARGTQEKVSSHVQILASALGVGVAGVDETLASITDRGSKAKHETYLASDYDPIAGYMLVTYQKGSANEWHLFGTTRMRSAEFCTMLRNMALAVDYAARHQKGGVHVGPSHLAEHTATLQATQPAKAPAKRGRPRKTA